MEPPSNILIIKLSAIGDVVHALPVAFTLKKVYPNVHISWAVHQGASGLLSNHPMIDKVIVIPRHLKTYADFRNVVSSLRTRKYDFVLDLQGLSKSGLWSYLSKGKKRIGFKGKESREINWLFLNRRICPIGPNIIDINLSLLTALGIPREEFIRDAALYPTNEDQKYIDRWCSKNNFAAEAFFFIDPFAGWSTKTWSHEHWSLFVRMFHEKTGMQPMILWGPNELHAAQELLQKIKLDAKEQNITPILAPETTLLQLAYFCKTYAKIMVAGDTGPMHIAASQGVPVVALFGASCAIRNAPSFAGARYITLQDTNQPCAGTFSRHCPFGHKPSMCLDTITPEMGIDAATNLLGIIHQG